MVRNAFCEAFLGASSSYQKPMSRYEHRPMSSHVTKSEQEVVGEHEREHRRGEQRQDRVVPALAVVVVHVADRVDLDARGHERDGHEQDRADGVELQAELEGLSADDGQQPRVVPLAPT